MMLGDLFAVFGSLEDDGERPDPGRGALRIKISCVLIASLVALGACNEKDAPGRVTPPLRPERIVSQTVTSDEILLAMGDTVAGRVVGISRMADDAAYSTVAGQWPRSVPRVAGSSEALVAIKPDLAIIADFTAIETQTLLAQASVPTLVLRGFDGFSAYRSHIAQVADAVGEPGQGERLRLQFEARLSAVTRPAGPDAPTAVSWIHGNVAGRGTSFHDEVTAAGYRNLAAERGLEGHTALPYEQLVAWNPDVIVIPCPDQEDCSRTERDLAGRDGISATIAGRNNQIIAVPTAFLYSAGMGMLKTVEFLAERRPDRSDPS